VFITSEVIDTVSRGPQHGRVVQIERVRKGETVAEHNAVSKGDVAERHIAARNESDADTRHRAVAKLWTEDGTYTDPLASVEGHEAIEAVIAGAREQFPGHVFKPLGDIDAHHDSVRRFG